MQLPESISDVDPFDLPEWLGSAPQVVWTPEHGLSLGPLVAGELGAGAATLPCDLLAVDEAYPEPVAGDAIRTGAHQAWRHGQVLLITAGGRLTLVVPGQRPDPGVVLEALGRLARAVAADPKHYAALLRVSESDQG